MKSLIFTLCYLHFFNLSIHLQTLSHLLYGTSLGIYIFVLLFFASEMKSPLSPFDSLPDTLRFIVFKKLSKFVRTLITKKRFSISTYQYRHMYIDMVRPNKRGKNFVLLALIAREFVSRDPISEYMDGEAISKNYLSHKFVVKCKTK